jgi:hypothetical protein
MSDIARQERWSDLQVAVGTDVNQQAGDGSRPLHWLVQHGAPLAVFDWALARGASVNAIGRGGWTPTTLCVAQGTAVILQRLVEAGGDVSQRVVDGTHPVVHLITQNCGDVVPRLLAIESALGEDLLSSTEFEAGSLLEDVAMRNGHAGLAADLCLEVGDLPSSGCCSVFS